MRVHYINILLFALPLNLLVNTDKKPHTTPSDTPITRSLCECELYIPINYDNDPQMKRIMEQFEDRTLQRFQEYDDRMQEKREKCKDKCDKEIQKIILKDKLEKQMEQQLTTLETKIETDDIPTCICEKSLADKVEKGCLKCTQNLGGIVAPSSGVLVGIAEGALYVWKDAAIIAAKAEAVTEGAAKGLAAGKIAGDTQGMKIVTAFLKAYSVDKFCPELFNSIGNKIPYNDVTKISSAIFEQRNMTCGLDYTSKDAICTEISSKFKLIPKGSYNPPPTKEAITNVVRVHVDKATISAKALADVEAADVSSKMTAQLTAEKTGEIGSIYASWQTAIIASIVVIVVIILIMVIIYLILRYRRKKKMKKKLQYIKLLEE